MSIWAIRLLAFSVGWTACELIAACLGRQIDLHRVTIGLLIGMIGVLLHAAAQEAAR